MTTAVAGARKLGKLPARVDVRTLRIGRYVDRAELPVPPPSLDLTDHVTEWPMYANDRVGDCTIAAAGHMIEAWTAESRGHPLEVSERSVLSAFDHANGLFELLQFDPALKSSGLVPAQRDHDLIHGLALGELAQGVHQDRGSLQIKKLLALALQTG